MTPSVRDFLAAEFERLDAGQSHGDQKRAELMEGVVARLADAVHADCLARGGELVASLRHNETAFRQKNYDKWRGSFDMLSVLRHVSIEAGELFQREFLRHKAYENERLLGVLLRLHAHACRVMGEVECLLWSGYPDGAFARWRSLHEIAVVALILRTHGNAAAEDFIKYGMIEAINGMIGHNDVAAAMGRTPFSTEELAPELARRDALIEACGDHIRARNGWATKYVGSSKFPNLQKAAGLSKWTNDYKAASRNIHFDYRDMNTLLGMVESEQDALLCGPSDAGMTHPAHCSAIALSQVTASFITCHVGEDGCPIDFSTSTILMSVIQKLVAEVGNRFLEADPNVSNELGGAPRQS